MWLNMADLFVDFSRIIHGFPYRVRAISFLRTILYIKLRTNCYSVTIQETPDSRTRSVADDRRGLLTRRAREKRKGERTLKNHGLSRIASFDT